jgi:hypothetical protein
MAKILKDIYVSWTWEGDEMLLEGFNVAIAPQGSDPNTEAIIIQKTSSEKTDILNRGTTQYEHIFRNITLNKDTNYIAWVQSLTEGFDSEWLSATGINVSDDGKATIATTDADGNPITSSGGDVTIDSAGITVVNGAFKLVNSSGSITIDDTGITANDGSKDTFKIDSNGNASFSGSINVGSNIAGVDTSAEDLETVSGSTSKSTTAETNAKKYADDDSKWVASNSREDANISSAGWYRIAMNTGNRAHATFKLRDTQSGQHNTVEFKLGCSYNRVSTADFQMTTFSRYGSLTFSKVRLLTNGTYDEMYVEVYLNSSASVRCEITDNIQSSGWQSVGWTSGSIPSGYSSTEWDIDVNTITIDGNGIKTTGANGNYSLLTDDQLAFYEAGSSTPHWYSKNVAYGTSQDGDYIELNWDKKPKVQTAIKSLMSYNSEHSASNQMYKSYPSSVSENGFYVSGKSTIVDAIFGLSGHSYTSGEYSSTSTINNTQTYQSPLSVSSVTNISCDINFSVSSIYTKWDYYSIAGYFSGYAKIKYKNNDGVTTTYDTLVFNRNISRDDIGYVTKTLINTNVTIDNLPEDRYYLIVELSITMSPNGDNPDGTFKCKVSNSVSNVTTKSDTIVDNGEVMWIAVEGGAD